MPKTNKYAFVFRDEENISKIVEWLVSSHYKCVISPLHDKDHWTECDIRRFIANNEKRYGIKIDPTASSFGIPTGKTIVVGGKRVRETRDVRIPEVGDHKTNHRHFMVKYDYSLMATTVREEFRQAGMDILYFEPVKSEDAYMLYLIHKNNPEKAQYSLDDVISLGGYDLSALYTTLSQNRDDSMKEIIQAVKKHPKWSFRSHVLNFEEAGRVDLAREMKNGAGFYRSLMWQEAPLKSER